MKVEFTDLAKADLQDLRRYLLKYKPSGSWNEVKRQIKSQIDYVAQYPNAGSLPDELAEYSDGYRQILTNQQRLIYKVTGNTLYVYLICGQAQDLEMVLTKRLTRS